MILNVLWLTYHPNTPPRGYWCTGWIEETLQNEYRETGHTFNHVYEREAVPDGEGAIVVIPTEYNCEYIDQINATIAALPWAIVILASDENGFFPVENLVPVTALWVMTPHFEKHEFPAGTRFLGDGCPPDARELLAQFKSESLQRPYRCSFSGQVTHERRYKMMEALQGFAFLNPTQGFTQGLPRDAYYRLLASTKCTPAPSGPVTLDSFRAFETLEAGGVPILDAICPVAQDAALYWPAVLGDHPLPVISDWHDAREIALEVERYWPLSSNVVFSWWQMYKRLLVYSLLDDVPGMTDGDITILIPTSPIPAHPSTAILDETIASVRFHHPTADILVMCDGVRAQQAERKHDYDLYVQEVCWKANFEWTNVTPIVFETHQHQANMTREALKFVRTPLIMFVEHDTPLVTDCYFDWERLINLGKSSRTDMIRLHHEAHIHPEHERLMIDHKTRTILGVPVRRTVQWSQRPHLAKTDYYRMLMETHFPPTCRTMIEDKLHSVAQCDPDDHRIHIYHPDELNIKRSYHTDAREDDPKYDMVFE